MFETILATIILLLLLVRFVDLVPQFYTWQSRIKIGRWNSESLWAESVLKRSRKWLIKTPVIKLTDQNRLILLDIISGNYKRDAIQYWQQASLVLGISKAYEKTGDPNLKKQILNFVSSKLNEDGSWKNKIHDTDGVILGYAFLQISWLDHDKYKPAYDALWELLQELTGEDGTVSYKSYTKKSRYVDTIGFICPFLILYGQQFNVPEAVDLGINQIKEFRKFGMYPKMELPCHTYSVETKIPVGLFGWGRGLGWYAIGLIDSWKALDTSHPMKQEMTTWVEDFAAMAMTFQNSNGAWGWIVTQQGARLDSSTTATLAWFLKEASSIPTIKKESMDGCQNALKYLMKVTRRDGSVDFSQGDTKAIGVHSQDFDILPFTQGFVLRTVMS